MIDSKQFINTRHKNQKINYDNVLKELIKEWERKNIRPKLLIHSCCAPCSTYVLEYLSKFSDITIFFSNSNIHPKEEYIKRMLVQKDFIDNFNKKTGNNVSFIFDEYKPSKFLKAVRGYEEEKEGGERCHICYEMRLNSTAEKAQELNFDYFASALTLSPKKNAQVINESGYELQEKISIYYLPSDFKKNNGYKRSIEMCDEYNIYRQCYCGCVFAAIKQGVDLKEINKSAKAFNENHEKYLEYKSLIK
ncbi:epoxyqueuosine reductase QueH [Gemella sp. zg-1178]|uniref:epoxyqueuosine reductase QueH n=1 Tax=Gemella sp. zg-1178 TaxID=2840372 RepID=UPI001C057714|nr:epoxyqueuosine reductase QueH [Gemella sp. zg-1178]MBU0278477.1 epoxyqueuosine reductase QueH [Gemella sp. zg-1178]